MKRATVAITAASVALTAAVAPHRLSAILTYLACCAAAVIWCRALVATLRVFAERRRLADRCARQARELAAERQRSSHELEMMTAAAITFTARQIQPGIDPDAVIMLQMLWADTLPSERAAHERSHDYFCEDTDR